jgi:exopolysaccharide biosynthesis polyprenyl glycosylphosphotransferase
VFSPIPNPAQQEPPGAEWARLIPGAAPTVSGKKPVQSTRMQSARPQSPRTQSTKTTGSEKILDFLSTPAAVAPKRAIAMLVPHPMQGRAAWKWVRSTAADFALVALDWLLIGALLVPLRALFPYVRLFHYDAGAPAFLLGIAVLHGALLTLIGHAEGLYAACGDLRRQAQVLGKSVLWATAFLCLAYALQGAWWTTCALIGCAGALHFGSLLVWRWQTWAQTRDSGRDARHVLNRRHVLIVGAGGVGQRLASYLEEHPEAGRTVHGFLDNKRNLGGRIIGRTGDLARLARTGFVDGVVLAAPHDRELTLQVVREARRLRLDVEIVPELFGCTPAGTDIERVGDLPLICLHAERLPSAGLALKRCVDVAGAIFGLAMLAPLLAMIAALIKMDSRGPVLYRAPRAGRKGELFRCYKLRTMVSNADELKTGLRQGNQRSGPFFKMANDPRVTKLGRFLRRYSLDELPQLWNVLRGEMSLVGPRPHTLDDFATYEIGHLARLDMTPGLTGLWQVTARRDPSFQRGMELDREYIRTWSLALDLRILLKTFQVVLRGSGQ